MSKKLIFLIVLVILAGLAYWMIGKQPWNTLKGELKDFAIKDTAHITRMFFADKKGNQVLLERNENNQWVVNNQYPADPDKVNIMLATMHDVQVRNPITEKQHNTVVGILATEGVKAEFYEGDKRIKTIYIGSSTPDQEGTYMLIEGSSEPFVTHINGFVGYLSPRFETIAQKWKTKELFTIPAIDIKEVSIQYPQNPKLSFTVTNGATPVLSSTNGVEQADAKFLQFYLGSFQHIFFEAYAEYTPQQTDSIYHTTPLCILKITKNTGEQTTLQIHLKPVDRRTKQQYDEKGSPLPFDPEKYYAFLNDKKEDVVIIQQYVFGRLLRTLDNMKTAH
jgi:hypothetical protein